MTAWRYEFFLLVYKNIFQHLKGNYLFCAAMLNLLFTRMRPRPQVSGYIWIRNFFFPNSKISTSTPYPYANRICPSTRIRHVSGFTLIHSSAQDSSGNICNRVCVVSARNLHLALPWENLGTRLPSWLHYSR